MNVAEKRWLAWPFVSTKLRNCVPRPFEPLTRRVPVGGCGAAAAPGKDPKKVVGWPKWAEQKQKEDVILGGSLMEFRQKESSLRGKEGTRKNMKSEAYVPLKCGEEGRGVLG